jgi:peroxiredoxin
MIGISSDGVEEKWQDFIVKNQMVWPQFLDRERKVQRAFEVTKFPTYIVIDHEGIVRYNASGAGPERMSSLDDAIRKQLKILAKTQPAE